MTLLTGGANCIKYVLFAFNFVFVITGIILISVGIAVSGVFSDYHIFLPSNFFSIPTLLIVTGILVFIIAFFGCCGAIKEHYCMIFSFSVLLGLIFILELIGGISGYVLRSDAKSLINTQIRATMPNYNATTHKDIVIMWDTVQRKFECCGVDNATDWEVAIHAIPMSCCSVKYGETDTATCSSSNENKKLFRQGCLTTFSDYIGSHAMSLGAVGIILAILQIVGIVFACYVAREIKIKNGGTGPFCIR